MAAKPGSWVALLVFLMAGCAAPAPQVKRIALLAPFESTYREIGYDALYPVKLALADEGFADVQLLSIDDGGSIEHAILRAQALDNDPDVYLTLVAGPIATDRRVLDRLHDTPVVIIGDWNAAPSASVFLLASEAINTQVTSQTADVYEAAMLNEAIGSDLFGLKSLGSMTQNRSNLTILTSAAPPSADFRARLLASELYVPAPGLLTTLAYDAGTMAARAVAQSNTRADVLAVLRVLKIDGLNGEIHFNTAGYWADAPIYPYQYTDGILTPIKP